MTVSAVDAFNNVATTYRGTVHFTTTDTGSGVVLPADYTFTAGDNGTHTFSGVAWATAGSQTVTATDTTTNSVNGTSGTITLSPATRPSPRARSRRRRRWAPRWRTEPP